MKIPHADKLPSENGTGGHTVEGVGVVELSGDVDPESTAADGNVIVEGSKPVTACDWADVEAAAWIPDCALQVVGRRRDDRLEPEDDPFEVPSTAFLRQRMSANFIPEEGRPYRNQRHVSC